MRIILILLVAGLVAVLYWADGTVPTVVKKAPIGEGKKS